MDGSKKEIQFTSEVLEREMEFAVRGKAKMKCQSKRIEDKRDETMCLNIGSKYKAVRREYRKAADDSQFAIVVVCPKHKQIMEKQGYYLIRL